MARERISFTNFNRRLWVAGGREQAPPGSLRRAKGVAPEATTSIRSRAGSTFLYSINAISLYRYNGHRYAYDGLRLFQDGAPIKTGFTGGRLTFVTMPPQPGVPDYLFILGGGVAPFKISPLGVISNWGIQPPRDSLQGLAGAADLLLIDDFTGANTVIGGGVWTPTNCSKAYNANLPPFGGAANSIVVTTTDASNPWNIETDFASVQNFAYYGDGRSSLTTDLVSFYVWINSTTDVLFISLRFDVDDGTFTNYLVANIQLLAVGVTPPIGRHQIDVVVLINGGDWTRVAIPKNVFRRVGSKLNKSWDTVKSIKIRGGIASNVNSRLGFQNLQISGSYGLGTGPAAILGGSTYLGQITFGNDLTGSDSNPNLQPAIVEGVAEGPIFWQNIPVSSDPQVTNRKLWRSSALPLGATEGPLFYVDTIHDNSTAAYTDIFADSPTPYTNTVWLASSTYVLNQLIDGGNGWLFKVTTAGTSGTVNPAWNAPGGQWIGLFSGFNIGDTIFDPPSGFVLQFTTAGTTGATRPNFASLGVGGTITDGSAAWTRLAAPTTADGTIVWTFAGLNSVPTLGNQKVLLDNAPPSATFGDAVGPFQGSMVWTRDSNPGFEGMVYFSPPGRPESVGLQINASSPDDPTQKAVIWETALWLLSVKKLRQIGGSYPGLAANDIDGSAGTDAPYSVVSVRVTGVIYAGQDGIRKFNNRGIDFIGFEALAPILIGTGGPGAEDLQEFNPTIAFETPFGEVVFTDLDSQQTLALSFEQNGDDPSWRVPGPVLNAGYFERDTGSVLASFNGNVYLFEEQDGPDG